MGGHHTALVAATVVLAVGLVVALALFRGGMPGGANSSAASQTGPIAPAAGSNFGALNGRWVRPDGGYILEIRSVDAGGKIDAGYFNPQPIRVARGEAAHEGSTLKVFVELRAPNYPGSTYTLTYDPKQDLLVGVYFQAALRQFRTLYYSRFGFFRISKFEFAVPHQHEDQPEARLRVRAVADGMAPMRRKQGRH